MNDDKLLAEVMRKLLKGRAIDGLEGYVDLETDILDIDRLDIEAAADLTVDEASAVRRAMGSS